MNCPRSFSPISRSIATILLLFAATAALCSCTSHSPDSDQTEPEVIFTEEPYGIASTMENPDAEENKAFDNPEGTTSNKATATPSPDTDLDIGADADALKEKLAITEDFRESFVHGDKPVAHQRYIVLHDTESEADAQSVIDWWDSNGNLVATHFVVNKDGSIWQCAPLDTIVHHAGFGDTGHNEKYGTLDESYDDKRGTTPIGDWASDYGMNSYSIGIEMVHTGGEGAYPEAQLEAVDNLIAYIDAYYGFESEIIDHKAWRSGNSDTSEEFAEHLASYQANRTHSDN